MQLVYNSNSTMHLPVLGQIRVARETGWDGIFLRAEHLLRALDRGYSPATIRTALGPLAPVNLGALADVERWEAADRRQADAEATDLTELAASVGATNVQVLSGPVAPGGPYGGPGSLSPAELRRVTAAGLRRVADLGAPLGIRYYLEPLAWTPISRLADAVAAVEAAERDNVGLLLDFWHLWHAGATPDELARLDPRIIAGVDFSDSLGRAGEPDPGQGSRQVWPGEGRIPLREWVAAIRSTGFAGWWDNELYSPLHWELADPIAVAAGLREVLAGLLED